MELKKRVQQRDVRTMKRLENLSYEDRLREFGLLRLRKRRFREYLINMYKYLMERCNGEGDVLFSVVPSFASLEKNTSLLPLWDLFLLPANRVVT